MDTPGFSDPGELILDASGNIYVPNYGYVNDNSVTVYAAGATGNVAPTQTISGSNTGLSNPVGVALDSSANINVTSSSSDSVLIYAAGANGNVQPIRTISGQESEAG